MRHFNCIIGLFLGVIGLISLNSCSSKTSSTPASPVAQLTSFVLRHDSFPDMQKTVFLIKERLDTGLVYNPDSIRFGMPVDSLRTVLGFYSTPSSAEMRMGDTSFILTGTDTLDYTRRPVFLKVVSADRSVTKVYEVDVRVHQVDPDLYSWQQVCDRVYSYAADDQRLFCCRQSGGDQLYCYVRSASGLELYVSENGGRQWGSRGISGLPSDCRPGSIISDGVSFCYADGAQIYTSADGCAWTLATADRSIEALLFYFPALDGNPVPWMICPDSDPERWMVCYWQGGALVDYQAILKSDFPVRGFSAIPFFATSGRSRMLLLGGYSSSDRMLGSRWNWEYVAGRGIHLTRYDKELPVFPAIADAAVVWYDNRLLLLGAMEATDTLHARGVYASVDEGLHWQRMDTTKCMLPAAMADRQRVQAVVLNEQDIILLGGEKEGTRYADVYSGRVCSIAWK